MSSFFSTCSSNVGQMPVTDKLLPKKEIDPTLPRLLVHSLVLVPRPQRSHLLILNLNTLKGMTSTFASTSLFLVVVVDADISAVPGVRKTANVYAVVRELR
jgi:hypothetical protein